MVSNRFVYSSAVNRLLQLAANMYDATTTNSFYPSVFRPVFTISKERNVFISGYHQIVGNHSLPSSGELPYPSTQLPLSQTEDVTLVNPGCGQLFNGITFYGVPWIIGAKKCLPRFNQFSMVNCRPVCAPVAGPGAKFVADANPTNQMFVMSVNNNLGVSFWNSYSMIIRPSAYRFSQLPFCVSLDSLAMSIRIGYYHECHPSRPISFFPPIIGRFAVGGVWEWRASRQFFFVYLWTNNVVPPAVYYFSSKSLEIITNGLDNLDSSWDKNQYQLGSVAAVWIDDDELAAGGYRGRWSCD